MVNGHSERSEESRRHHEILRCAQNDRFSRIVCLAPCERLLAPELVRTPTQGYNSAVEATETPGKAPLRRTGKKVDCERDKPTTRRGVRDVCICVAGGNPLKLNVYLTKEPIRCR